MSELVVLCPTRGRPGAALEAWAAFQATRAGDSRLVFVVDEDDLKFDDYRATSLDQIVVPQASGGNMVKALNYAAAEILAHPVECVTAKAIGFIGDDHRFRSWGWDRAVLAHIDRGSSLVFGDDMAHSSVNLPVADRLPTQVFIASPIIAALGWMAPPGLHHLYVDDAWLQLGNALGTIAYDPSIIIEHMHPAYGKAKSDAGYERVNSAETYGHDRQAFGEWMETSFEADIAKARAAA